MTKRLLLNSLSGALLYLVNIIIAFLMSPIILRELGNRDYGVWEMILSLCGYLGILELGVGPAIIRYVSREQAVGNREALESILSSALVGLALVGGLVLTVMLAAALAPQVVLRVSPGEVQGLRLLLVIVGCSLCVQFIGTLFVAYLMGLQEHLRVNALRVILAPIQSVALYFVLIRADGYELNRLAGVGLLGNLVQYGIFAAMVLARPEVTIRRHSFSWATVRELYRFGANSMILMVSDRVQRQSLPLVIGHTLGAANVVFYAIPKRLVDYARDLVLAMGTPLMPYLSAAEATRARGERSTQWIPLSRAIALISVPGTLLALALGKPFVAVWLGSSYAEGGQWVIVALASSFFLTGFVANSGRVLLAAARHGPPARRVLIVSVAALGAAIPVTAEAGVTGSAAVLALAEVLGAWIFWRAASREIGIGLAEHLRRTARPLLLPGALMALALIIGRWAMPNPGYAGLAGVAGGSSALYLLCAWRWALHGDERRRVRGKSEAILRRR